jgi:hypothetical protein
MSLVKVMSKARIQEFFDIMGMDVLSASSIPTYTVVDGKDVACAKAAISYVYRSHFGGLVRDFEEYVSYMEIEDIISPEGWAYIKRMEWES